ncbi:TPA: HAD family hydrolase [Thermoplasmata archaeon]|nr:HAD family hydrolase [Thermoplasmata archaeon]
MTSEAPLGTRTGSRLRGVIFDLDDTLVLSTVDYARFKRLIIDRISSMGDDPGLYSPDEGIIGLIDRFSERMLGKGWTKGQVNETLDEFEAIMDSVEMERVHETRVLEGARELLEYLDSRGVRIGILTRGCATYAEEALRLSGLRDHVHALECRNPSMPAKPNPEPYWHLVEQLGLRPEETVFVGDYLLDAICAQRAGVPFIGVMTGDLTEEQLREAGSVAVFPSVAHLVPWFESVLETDNEL